MGNLLMLKRKKYNLTAQEREAKRKEVEKLVAEKEKVYLDKPWQGYCDDDTHPLFSILVTKQKPKAVCYYCSKMWILDG